MALHSMIGGRLWCLLSSTDSRTRSMAPLPLACVIPEQVLSVYWVASPYRLSRTNNVRSRGRLIICMSVSGEFRLLHCEVFPCVWRFRWLEMKSWGAKISPIEVLYCQVRVVTFLWYLLDELSEFTKWRIVCSFLNFILVSLTLPSSLKIIWKFDK